MLPAFSLAEMPSGRLSASYHIGRQGCVGDSVPSVASPAKIQQIQAYGADLVGLYQRAASGRYATVGLERIFEAGFKEFLKLKGRPHSDLSALLDESIRLRLRSDVPTGTL